MEEGDKRNREVIGKAYIRRQYEIEGQRHGAKAMGEENKRQQYGKERFARRMVFKEVSKKTFCVVAVCKKETCKEANKGCFQKVDWALKSRWGREEMILE